MSALDSCASWPVPHVGAAVIEHVASGEGRRVAAFGETDRTFRLASLTKPMTAWAILVAVEEGIVELDAVLPETLTGQASCTLRHLLSHAGGYPFAGRTPISSPERTRTYSNGGIELAAQHVESASEMSFADYLHLAVFEPLNMTQTSLVSSPAYGASSTVDDMVRFLTEVRHPTLVSATTAADAVRIQYPSLGGMVPGVGRYTQCPWGLGIEIRGDKQPHWTGANNGVSTYGHFGGAGTMMWTDPDAELSVVALTDRPFEEWADTALAVWPQLSDAVLHEYRAHEAREHP